MATHSSILDWRIPWTKEPGRLQSIGSQLTGLSIHTCTTNITGINRHIQQEYYQLKHMGGGKSSTDMNTIDNFYQVQHLAYVIPFKG